MITVCTINHIYFFNLLLPARRTRLNFYTDGRDECERILFKKDRRSSVRTRLLVFRVNNKPMRRKNLRRRFVKGGTLARDGDSPQGSNPIHV